MQMFAAEHFVRSHHVWTCTACPVHDPRTGDLLGVVDVSGPGRDRAPHDRRAGRHRGEAGRGQPVAAARGPAGGVAQRGRAAAVRAARPRPRGRRPRLGGRGHRHAEPGAHRGAAGRPAGGRPRGRGVRARAGPGWLAAAGQRVQRDPAHAGPRRPGRRGPSSTAPAAGCTRCPPGTPRCWCCWPAPAPPGWTPARCRRALYGDREHLVTVRAEMSRLRRSLGGLLLARPYRIAPEVEVVLPDPVVIPNSTAPGLRPP